MRFRLARRDRTVEMGSIDKYIFRTRQANCKLDASAAATVLDGPTAPRARVQPRKGGTVVYRPDGSLNFAVRLTLTIAGETFEVDSVSLLACDPQDSTRIANAQEPYTC